MVDKKKIVVDSVKKLVSLKLSDDEIIINLKEVGIGPRDARQIIREAKKQIAEDAAQKLPPANSIPAAKPAPAQAPTPKPAPVPLQKPMPSPKPVPSKPAPAKQSVEKKKSAMNWLEERMGKTKEGTKEEKLKTAEMVEQISEQQGVTEEKPAPAPKPAPVEKSKEFFAANLPQKEEPAPKPAPVPAQAPTPKPTSSTSVDLSKVWETGILASVDDKLIEIKKIRKEIDTVLTKKADEIAKKEVDKIQVLFESQQSLFLDKINTQLEAKEKELEVLIDEKIKQMKAISEDIAKQINAIEAAKQKHTEFLKDAESQLKEISETKNKLVSEMNSELIKSKSAQQESIDAANAKVRDIDERVNKTLEVGLSVIDGLKSGASRKLDEMVSTQLAELSKKIESKAGGMGDTEKALEMQIKEKLQEVSRLEAALKTRIEQTGKLNEEALKGLSKQINDRIDSKEALLNKRLEVKAANTGSAQKAMEAQIKEHFNEILRLEKTLEERIAKIDKLEQAVKNDFDPATFKQQAEDFESFKKQFIKVIELNVAKFNKAIRVENEKAKALDEQTKKSAEFIDKKIAELEEFERTFAEEMGVVLEKGMGKKAASANKAPNKNQKKK